MAKDNNGWDEYKKLILYSLEQLQKDVACLKQSHREKQEQFDKFLEEYKLNVSKVKMYLSLGVGIAGALFQTVLFGVDHVIGKFIQ